jgi:hypothetical protein
MTVMAHEAITKSEDNLLIVKRLFEVAELIHYECTYLHTSHENMLHTITLAEVTDEINKRIYIVQRDVLQCIDKMFSAMSRFPAHLIEPIYRKLERRSAVQVGDLIRFPKSFSTSPPVVGYWDEQLSLIEVHLRKQYKQLVERLDARSIAGKMYQYRAITRPELEAINANRLEPCKAAEALLEVLISRWQEVGRIFMQALKEVNQDEIYLQLYGIGMTHVSYKSFKTLNHGNLQNFALINY